MRVLEFLLGRPKEVQRVRVPGETDHALLFSILAGGHPRTLKSLTEQTGIPTPTVSARLRDFRKEGHVVERFRENLTEPWQYRLKPRHDLRDPETGKFSPRLWTPEEDELLRKLSVKP